ncbi:hypothetical protein HMPREF9074_07409 [Capnocytophaga sp. oral taxon 329 str. F0087]|nr:hypothetical protein HMPREF9074_07409 [Capnocytophaga sp. oral taxon 329 str. F0087]
MFRTSLIFRLLFVTYSAAPARRLSFAHRSLIVRLTFAHPISFV